MLPQALDSFLTTAPTFSACIQLQLVRPTHLTVTVLCCTLIPFNIHTVFIFNCCVQWHGGISTLGASTSHLSGFIGALFTNKDWLDCAIKAHLFTSQHAYLFLLHSVKIAVQTLCSILTLITARTPVYTLDTSCYGSCTFFFFADYL